MATDTGWAAGDGPPVEGPVQALLKLLTGRTSARDQLTGEGAVLLTWAPGPPRVAAEDGSGASAVDRLARSTGRGDHQV